jgi:RimJ/RimL family protein N-acetyltransferase
LWARWLNDLEVALPLAARRANLHGSGPDRVIEDILRSPRPRLHHIVNRATEQPIGRRLMFAQPDRPRTAEVRIFITGEKDCWGKGYGTEAMRLLLDYAFNLLNLHSVMLGAFAFNQRALRFVQEPGFRKSGGAVRRESSARPRDVVPADLLAEEFDLPVVAGPRPRAGRSSALAGRLLRSVRRLGRGTSARAACRRACGGCRTAGLRRRVPLLRWVPRRLDRLVGCWAPGWYWPGCGGKGTAEGVLRRLAG